MTETQWLECIDPDRMLAFLADKVSPRIYRLFAVACCRPFAETMCDPRRLQAIEIAEQHAENLATDLDLARAEDEAYAALMRVPGDDVLPLAIAIWELLARSASSSAHAVSLYCCMEAGRQGRQLDEQRRQCALLRELVGNPFCPVAIDPSWLTPTCIQLSTLISQQRLFDLMPILGDALQDAGCDDEQVLHHCYQHTQHVNGCWLLGQLVATGEVLPSYSLV